MGPSTLGEQTSRQRRVRHRLPPTSWPTEDEAARSRWLQPLRLGSSVVAEQRTWVPAMVPWRATADGVVTPEVLDWYGRFADGRPGVLVVEATGIRDVPSGPLLRIGDDRFVPGLARLVEMVRRRSAGHTRLFIQVIDFVAVRRRPTPEAYFGRHLAVTPHLRDRLARAVDDARWLEAPESAVRDALLSAPRAVHEQVLPDLFAAAARRALEAGFDGTELHYAHAYTMAGFLSRLNTRAD
ncbi:MAG TPA: NADH:flavin oxidoreductase, partial [Methylomirabilota bacterium]|nr:NADH:flavin oxidoreductase [Methylomirabilota bacterium]